MQTQTFEIQWGPVDRPIPYARNAREIPQVAVDKVAASLQEFGWRQPIVVDTEGVVVVGHVRLKAAQKLGWAQVPVHVAADLTPAQIKAYRLMDNRSHEEASWDDELLRLEMEELQGTGLDLGLTGFELPQIEEMLRTGTGSEGEVQVAPEEVPEPPAQPVSRLGDLWLLGDHRLLNGDSTSPEDIRRLMQGERALLFATDPPYLVGYDGMNHLSKNGDQANKDWSETYGPTWDDADTQSDLYERFIRTAIQEAVQEHAAWYCWHASRRQGFLEGEWEKAGAFVHQQIIWVKNNPVLTRTWYLWQHEPCFFGWVKGNKPTKATEDYQRSVWQVASLAGDERPDHPTPKPPEVFAIPMRQHTRPGDLCFEPFSGSGSQIIAGQELGRRVYACEIGPAYVDVAIQWWQKRTGQAAVLDGDGRTFGEVAQERQQGEELQVAAGLPLEGQGPNA